LHCLAHWIFRVMRTGACNNGFHFIFFAAWFLKTFWIFFLQRQSTMLEKFVQGAWYYVVGCAQQLQDDIYSSTLSSVRCCLKIIVWGLELDEDQQCRRDNLVRFTQHTIIGSPVHQCFALYL
jgi:hypothetical protein